jgi:hypothetical protein
MGSRPRAAPLFHVGAGRIGLTFGNVVAGLAIRAQNNISTKHARASTIDGYAGVPP